MRKGRASPAPPRLQNIPNYKEFKVYLIKQNKKDKQRLTKLRKRTVVAVFLLIILPPRRSQIRAGNKKSRREESQRPFVCGTTKPKALFLTGNGFLFGLGQRFDRLGRRFCRSFGFRARRGVFYRFVKANNIGIRRFRVEERSHVEP